MRLTCLIVILLAIISATVSGETLYVSPQGRDTWSGRYAKPRAGGSDGPLASLAGARDAVRRVKANGQYARPITVLIAGGTYRLAGPVVFAGRDSGTEQAPISYAAAPGAKPILTGGRRIGGWKRQAGGVWTARVPLMGGKHWRFEQLWVNGRRATRARLPRAFYYYTSGKVGEGIDSKTGKPVSLARRAFRAEPRDIAPITRLSLADLRNTVAVVYHSWEVSRHYLDAADARASTVTLAGPGAPWDLMYWGPRQRYHLENVREGLRDPGSWYLGTDGVVAYRPLPGEDMARAEVVAPMTEQFLLLQGTADAPVAHLRFRGLSFRHSQYLLPAEGHGDAQAAFSIPAVVMADHAREVSLERCEVAQTGIYGVWFRRGCTNCRIVRCYLHDLGAGGIRLGEGAIRHEGPERTGRNVVDNNIVRGVGRVHRGAIGIWVGQTGDNRITHNDISDTYYTGISVGWTWGYGPSLTQNNRIDQNHIHRIGQGVLSDMGGIYTLGNAEGSTISGNVIHDVYSYDLYGRGGWGLYNDEGSTRYTLENNLVHHVKTGTYHQHYGRENVVRNNILAFSMDGQLQRSRVEEHLSFTFSRNIVYWDESALFSGSWGDKNVGLDHNVYWNASGAPVTFEGRDLASWQATGKDQGSVVADAGFVAPAKRDFRLRPDSSALAVGFRPFDYQSAGVYGDRAWVRLARDYRYAPLRFAPPAPPTRITLDFEDVPVGGSPPIGRASIEGKGDAIAVTDETAASGARSLELRDAPGLQHLYDPHVAFEPGFASGAAVGRFAMRVAADAVLFHEWRDWRTEPYRVGPSLWVDHGVLRAGGRELMRIPADAWVRYEIRCGLGPQASATWDLSVTLPGQPPRRFRLPVGDPRFRALTWAGFVSNADYATTFWLDDITLGAEPARR